MGEILFRIVNSFCEENSLGFIFQYNAMTTYFRIEFIKHVRDKNSEVAAWKVVRTIPKAYLESSSVPEELIASVMDEVLKEFKKVEVQE